MSEQFEESLKSFYQNERISSTQLLNTSDQEKVSNKDLANNLDFCIKFVISLSRISLKHFYKIQEKQKVLEEKLNICEKELLKTQKNLKKNLTLIENTLSENKPLTKTEVQTLVLAIAQQPKIVEEQALKLTSDLEKKVVRVEELIQHLIKIIS